jgi:hypothetical protein
MRTIILYAALTSYFQTRGPINAAFGKILKVALEMLKGWAATNLECTVGCDNIFNKITQSMSKPDVRNYAKQGHGKQFSQ